MRSLNLWLLLLLAVTSLSKFCLVVRAAGDLGGEVCEHGTNDDGECIIVPEDPSVESTDMGEEEEAQDYKGEEEDEEEYFEEEEDYCHNVAEDCFSQSLDDGCILNFESMVEDCQLTCYFCSPEENLDHVSNVYSHVPQQLYNDPSLAEFVARVDEYMYEKIYRSNLPDNVKLSCKNKDSQCSYWAHTGQCGANKEFMLDRCPAACMECESGLTYATRCPFDENDAVIWEGGDMHQMFTHLVTSREHSQFSPEILSRPIANPNPKFHERDGPWIVVLEDFLSEDQCDTLMKLAEQAEFEKLEGTEEESEVERSFSFRTCGDDCFDAEIMEQIEEVSFVGRTLF